MKLPIFNQEAYQANKRMVFALGNAAIFYGALKTGRRINLGVTDRLREGVNAVLPMMMKLPDGLGSLNLEVPEKAKEAGGLAAEGALTAASPLGRLILEVLKARNKQKGK